MFVVLVDAKVTVPPVGRLPHKLRIPAPVTLIKFSATSVAKVVAPFMVIVPVAVLRVLIPVPEVLPVMDNVPVENVPVEQLVMSIDGLPATAVVAFAIVVAPVIFNCPEVDEA